MDEKTAAIQRVMAELARLQNDALALTLHVTAAKHADIARRLVEAHGADLRAAHVYLALHDMAANDESAKHLFAPAAAVTKESADDAKLICGVPADLFNSLPPVERMKLHEKHEAQKRAAAMADQQSEADKLAAASRPADFDTWSAERKLQFANEAAALVAAKREKASA